MTTLDRKPAQGHSAADILASRKARNVWLALALVAFVLVILAVTMIRIRQTRLSDNDRFYFSGALQKNLIEQEQRKQAGAPVTNQVDDTPTRQASPDDMENDQ